MRFVEAFLSTLALIVLLVVAAVSLIVVCS